MSSWYYQGCLTRQEAEAALSRLTREGAFLVRDSESIPGAYSLCLWSAGKLHQYRIIRDREDQFYIKAEAGVEERKYGSLDLLIEDYMARKGANGLSGQLLYPLRKKSALNDYELEHSVDNEDPLTCHFQQQLQRMDLSRLDGDFTVQLRRYVDSQLFHDARRIKDGGSGGDSLLYFRDFIRDSMGSLIREIEFFHMKLAVLQEIFCGSKGSQNTRKPLSGSSVQEVLDSLSTLAPAYNSLEALMSETWSDLLHGDDMEDSPYYNTQPLNDLDSEDSGGITRPLFAQVQRTSAYKHTFFVKTGTTKFLQKNVTLLLDLKSGFLMIVRQNQQSLDQSVYIDHDKILQLVKSRSNSCLLEIKYSDRKKESFLFERVQQRELFCQLVSHMKRTYSRDPEPDVLSIFVGTWNMGGEMNSWSLIPWLKSVGVGKGRETALTAIPHDLYVVGTQESASTEKEWERSVKMFLDQAFSLKYETVGMTSLWGIRVLILCKVEHKNRISNFQSSCVRTGFRNTMGNKGAVGVSFNFCATSFCFINCHLTSGSEKSIKRDQNYRDILRNLTLGDRRLSTGCDVTHLFDHVFWFGDLNYRVEEEYRVIVNCLEHRNMDSLLAKDQLTQSQIKRTAFNGFEEEDINFPPTYRYERGKRDVWAWQKVKGNGVRINVPSWCDRVLWCSRENLYLLNTSYGSNLDFTTSDHKPVFSSFQVGITSEYAAPPPTLQNKLTTTAHITGPECHLTVNFDTVIVKLKNGFQKQHFVLLFNGRIIGDQIIRSKQNTHFLTPEELHIASYNTPASTSTSTPSGSTSSGSTSTSTTTSYAHPISLNQASTTGAGGGGKAVSDNGSVSSLGSSNDAGHHGQQQNLSAVWQGVFQPLEVIAGIDRSQVEEAHVLISVVTADGGETIGNCVISLKNLICGRPRHIEQSLTLQGEESGHLLATCHVSGGPGWSASWGKKKRKTYEFVATKSMKPIHPQNLTDGAGSLSDDAVVLRRGPGAGLEDLQESSDDEECDPEGEPAETYEPVETSSAFRPVHPAGITTAKHGLVKMTSSTSPNTLRRFLSEQPSVPIRHPGSQPSTSLLSRSGPPSSSVFQNPSLLSHNDTSNRHSLAHHPIQLTSGVSQSSTANTTGRSQTLAVHNEAYCCTADLRGGVPSSVRQWDARVDLSQLEANLTRPPPALPPKRNTVIGPLAPRFSDSTNAAAAASVLANEKEGEANTLVDRRQSLDHTPCRGNGTSRVPPLRHGASESGTGDLQALPERQDEDQNIADNSYYSKPMKKFPSDKRPSDLLRGLSNQITDTTANTDSPQSPLSSSVLASVNSKTVHRPTPKPPCASEVGGTASYGATMPRLQGGVKSLLASLSPRVSRRPCTPGNPPIKSQNSHAHPQPIPANHRPVPKPPTDQSPPFFNHINDKSVQHNSSSSGGDSPPALPAKKVTPAMLLKMAPTLPTNSVATNGTSKEDEFCERPYATAMKINGRVVSDFEPPFSTAPKNGLSGTFSTATVVSNASSTSSHLPALPARINGRGDCSTAVEEQSSPTLGEVITKEEESEVEYITLLRPVNLTRWLECLQLSQYTDLFLASKWNALETAKNIVERDLLELGILEEAHRRRILDSLHLI